ncbi:hypothetical protein [Spirosoma daeguense]
MIGVEKAIIVGNFQYWISENEKRSSKSHFQQGEYWTYDSAKGLAQKYPYLNEKSIARWLVELAQSGWIKKECFNKNNLDKTSWYGRGERLIDFLNSPISQNEESKPQATLPISQNEISISQNDTSTPQNEKCTPQNEECNIKDTVNKLTVIKLINKPQLKTLCVANRDDVEVRKFIQDFLNKKKKRKPPRIAVAPPNFPADWPTELKAFYLERWLPFRQSKKSAGKLLPASIQAQVDLLGELTHQQAMSCMNYSLSNGYTGLIFDKFKANDNPAKNAINGNAHTNANPFGQGAIIPTGATYRQQSFGRRKTVDGHSQPAGSGTL